ncbi:uncharacterized protein LOC102714986 [Oryza brachyantha]|nr:uncharacterized protein LOC102714986 [Oryza brachyantha]
MGAKLSCIYRPDSAAVDAGAAAATATATATARVVAADGSLRELPASSSPCVSVASDVLGDDTASFFVCNSDALYFDARPPALAPGEPLRPGELYFVLPRAMLGRPLSSADMGRLAVRASAALAGGSKPQQVHAAERRHIHRHGGGGKKKKKKVQVTPAQRREDDVDGVFNEKVNEQTLGLFAVFLSPARGGGAAAARSPLKRALSLVEEEEA